MDKNGMRLHGVIHHNATFGARVVWHEGNLYVLRTTNENDPDDIDLVVFQGVEQPKRKGGSWQTLIGGQALVMQPPSCSCKRAKNLKALTVEDIVNRAASIAA